MLYFDIRVFRSFYSKIHPYSRTKRVIVDEGDFRYETLADEKVIEVDYDLVPVYTGIKERDIRIEKRYGTLYFMPDEIEKVLLFKIYKR